MNAPPFSGAPPWALGAVVGAVVCFLLQSERFFDLTGGLTYLAVTAFSLWAGSTFAAPSAREWIVSALVAVWAVRLSSFLFLRIHRAGKDGRFDDLKTSPVRFLVPWTLQALWVFVTLNVVIVLNCKYVLSSPLGLWDAVGTHVGRRARVSR